MKALIEESTECRSGVVMSCKNGAVRGCEGSPRRERLTPLFQGASEVVYFGPDGDVSDIAPVGPSCRSTSIVTRSASLFIRSFCCCISSRTL